MFIHVGLLDLLHVIRFAGKWSNSYVCRCACLHSMSVWELIISEQS